MFFRARPCLCAPPTRIELADRVQTNPEQGGPSEPDGPFFCEVITDRHEVSPTVVRIHIPALLGNLNVSRGRPVIDSGLRFRGKSF